MDYYEEPYERIAVIKYTYGNIFPMVRFLDSIEYKNNFFGRSYRNPSMSSMKRLERIMKLMAISITFDEYAPIISAFRLFTPTSFSVPPDTYKEIDEDADWMDELANDYAERDEGHPGHPSNYGDS